MNSSTSTRNNKIYLVYLHGIGIQSPSFYEAFHSEVENITSEYTPDGFQFNLVPIPIFWYGLSPSATKEEALMYSNDQNFLSRWMKRSKIGFMEFILYPMSYSLSHILMILFALASIFILLFVGGSLAEMWIFWLLALFGLIFDGLAILYVFTRYYFFRGVELTSNIIDPLISNMLLYFRNPTLSSSTNSTPNRINSSYKYKIMSLIEKRLEEEGIEEDSEVIFISHSFGSVIAFDFLTETGHIYFTLEKEKERENLPFKLKIIITMGSPLQLYLSSFLENKEFLRIRTGNDEDTNVLWYNIGDYFDPIARPILIDEDGKNGELGAQVINFLGFTKRPFFDRHRGYWTASNSSIEKITKNLNKQKSDLFYIPSVLLSYLILGMLLNDGLYLKYSEGDLTNLPYRLQSVITVISLTEKLSKIVGKLSKLTLKEQKDVKVKLKSLTSITKELDHILVSRKGIQKRLEKMKPEVEDYFKKIQ